MIVEVIVQQSKEIVEAAYGRASRVELVSNMDKGGLTPDERTIKDCLLMDFLPVHIMVRPHDDSFIYSDQDKLEMLDTIALIDKYHGTNIVVGALNEDLSVDEVFLETIISQFPQMNITFHRAFDQSRDVFEAYDVLSKYPEVKWILTSGGKDNCMEGQEHLKELVKRQREVNGPIIMPGSGLDLNNIQALDQTIQADAYHFGKAVRLNHSFDYGFDQNVLRSIIEILHP